MRKNTKACTETEGWKRAQEKSRAFSKQKLQERIDAYNKNPRLCKHCQKPISYKLIQGVPKRVFCSQSCAATYHNKKRQKAQIPIPCVNCQTPLTCTGWRAKGTDRFCGRICQTTYYYKEFISLWLSGKVDGGRKGGYVSNHVRRYLLDQCGNKCAQCGWNKVNSFTGNIPLEVEHKDGDCLNNRPDNLTILCPSCHALTATYKGANKGKGRSAKNVYNGQGYNLMHPENYRSQCTGDAPKTVGSDGSAL